MYRVRPSTSQLEPRGGPLASHLSESGGGTCQPRHRKTPAGLRAPSALFECLAQQQRARLGCWMPATVPKTCWARYCQDFVADPARSTRAPPRMPN
eukprot:7052643-Pyramimonas_sp.AAC.1